MYWASGPEALALFVKGPMRVVGVDAGKGAASKAQIARGRIVTLATKPAEVELNLAKTAVVVMDMQNDFGSKDGMFDRAGFDISIVQRTVPPKAKVLAAARSAGIKVVYLKMRFRSDLSDMGAPDSPSRLLPEPPFPNGNRFWPSGV